MTTVAHVVEDIVKRKPFLEEAIARGIVNYTELAKWMGGEVEMELGKPASHAAIMMAIRRLGGKLEEGYAGRPPISFGDGGITMKSDLFELTVPRSEEAIAKIADLYGVVDFRGGDFLTVTQGLHEVTLISNRKYTRIFKEKLRNEGISKIIDNLASITIKIPASAVDTVGHFYVVTKALEWENINVIEIVSTFTELTFILNERDAARAFSILDGLLKERRNM